MKSVRFGVALFALVTALPAAAQIPYERLVKSDSEPANWLSYGGNYYGQRFSGLIMGAGERHGRHLRRAL